MPWWAILIIVFLLVSIPFLIPVKVYFKRYTGEKPEWSIYYGTLLIAPGGGENIANIVVNFTRRFRFLIIPIRWIFRMIFHAVQLVSRAITGGIRLIRSLINRLMRSGKPTDSGVDQTNDRIRMTGEEEASDFYKVQNAEDETGDHSGWDSESPHIEQEEDFSFPFEGSDRIDEPEEDSDTSEAPSSDDWQFSEPAPSPHLPGKQGMMESLKEVLSVFSEKKQLLFAYLALFQKYKKLLFRTLSSFFRFAGRCFRSIDRRSSFIALTASGDPAILGETLGWYYVLTGVIDSGHLPELLFHPDFENHEYSISVDIDLAYYLYPYKFVFSFAALLISLPYRGWWRFYREVRKEQTDE